MAYAHTLYFKTKGDFKKIYDIFYTLAFILGLTAE